MKAATGSTCALAIALLAACARREAAAPPTAAAASGPRPAADAIAWEAGPPLAASRDHHATFVDETPAGRFLYVVGGTTDGPRFLADAWRAPLDARGAVGAWVPATPLPEARAGMGVVVADHHVVLVAGKPRRAKAQSTGVWLSTVGPDGALGAWREGPPLPAPRFHLTASLARGFVYAIGGLDDASTSTATVFRAPLGPDGALGAWSEARPLPATRSHHAAFVSGEWLYVTGGLRGDPTNDADTTLADALRSHVEADGSLGPWTAVTSLDAPLATHAATVDGAFVYLFGGIEGDVTSHVRRARLLADGGLGAWELVSPMPRARGHVHQVPAADHRFYAVSGNAGGHGTTPDVSVGVVR